MEKSANQKLVERARKIAEKNPAAAALWQDRWKEILPELSDAATKMAEASERADRKYMERYFLSLARASMLESFVKNISIPAAKAKAIEAIEGKR